VNHDQDLIDDLSDQEMARLLGRTVQRGSQIRRRRVTTWFTLAALAICLVAVPITLSMTRSQPPDTGTTSAILQTTSAGPFQDVVWKQYFNPRLNVAQVHFPGNIGCNPGSPYGFRVEVLQVSYLRIKTKSSPLALALVRCDNGTPAPSSLYAFSVKAGSAEPQLLQTLLAPPVRQAKTIWYATSFSISKDAVVLPARGVTGTAALCCPNVTETMRWTLSGAHFIRQSERISKLP
jgi:hypothetical protein